MLDTLLHGNCLELMKQIPDHSIDMVLCDLPYEVLHKNNPNSQWDRMLPMDELWAEYLRITKENAAIVLFGQGLFSARLMMSQPDIWKYNLVWDKDRVTGFLNANRMPMRNHEDILVFYRKQPVYNPQMTQAKGPNHPRGNGRHRQNNSCYGSYDNTDSWRTNLPSGSAATSAPLPSKKVGKTYDYDHINRVPPTSDPNLRFPRSILHFPKEHGKKAWHPTQKPVALLQYLIRTYTNGGGIILDNCAGSGSTCIAAIRENRHFIAMELNDEYYSRASRDIAAELAQPSLPFEF